jgi:glycine/D-amino acid oxidase-like deaminating enzyme
MTLSGLRICVVGGGLTGTMLGWRLARRPGIGWVDLLVGSETCRDATAVSGGVVRGYEAHVEQRRLAIDSLVELRASPLMRQWSGYEEAASVYLRAGAPGVVTEVQEIETAVPGSARLVTAVDLSRRGWANLPFGTVGVLERRAGHVSPTEWRTALIADLAGCRSATVRTASLQTIALRGDGTVRCTVDGLHHEYDLVVLAAGPWTPGLLKRLGFGFQGLRTKSIQYGLYSAAGARPPAFVDETSGLYGKPTADGGLLLGHTTDDWDVRPGTRPFNPEQQRQAARLANRRLGMIELRSLVAAVNASDCYGSRPVLSLRPVRGSSGAVHTFTGGSGGSVKSALAASRLAAARITGTARTSSSLCSQHGVITS